MLMLFEPEAKNDEGELLFSGFIKLKPCDFETRCEIYEDAGFETSAEGVDVSTGTMKATRKMLAKIKDYIVEVDIVVLEDGMEHKTFEELTFDPRCTLLLFELAGSFINKLRPTKN